MTSDIPIMDSCFFFVYAPKKTEKTLKKREKVLAFPGIRGILMFHYALKQGAPLQF